MSARLRGVKPEKHPTERRGLSRHLEGWQPALVSLAIAFMGALLFVPRAVAPELIPLPHVDARETRRQNGADRALAERALHEDLPFIVRALGEAVRGYGAAEHDGRSNDSLKKLLEIRGLTRNARKQHGDDPLHRLRAVETEMFLRALDEWEHGVDRRTEIAELGGAFLEKARASGWLEGDRKLVATEAERRALFQLRWVEMTGLRADPAFAPTANQLRIYYRFLLEHPDKSAGNDDSLRTIAAVEKLDLDYPGNFARGVVYYRAGYFTNAARAFEAHLAKHPDGPWRLRAQNHLLAAAQRSRESTPAP